MARQARGPSNVAMQARGPSAAARQARVLSAVARVIAPKLLVLQSLYNN